MGYFELIPLQVKGLLNVKRRWACPPEVGAAATHTSPLLHSETLCPELVLPSGVYVVVGRVEGRTLPPVRLIRP